MCSRDNLVFSVVQQEKRMSKATEVMMQYVENLKRTYEKDHAELMEFKKLANQNSNRSYGGSVETGGKRGKLVLMLFAGFHLCYCLWKDVFRVSLLISLFHGYFFE